jgi:hypothetical protein
MLQHSSLNICRNRRHAESYLLCGFADIPIPWSCRVRAANNGHDERHDDKHQLLSSAFALMNILTTSKAFGHTIQRDSAWISQPLLALRLTFCGAYTSAYSGARKVLILIIGNLDWFAMDLDPDRARSVCCRAWLAPTRTGHVSNPLPFGFTPPLRF